MNYNYMKYPLKFDSFKEMTTKEAKNYFDWFISEIPNRINILSEYIAKDRPDIVLDYSVDSLVELWGWLESKCYMIRLTEEEYIGKLEQYPKWVWDYISDKNLAPETIQIATDVAIYYGEVIRINNKSIEWKLVTKPKSDAYYNQPALFGFCGRVHFNPQAVLLVMLRKSVKEKNKKSLLDNYNVWIGYINEENENL